MANLAAYSIYGIQNGDQITSTPTYPVGVVVRSSVAQIIADSSIVSGGSKVIFIQNSGTYEGATAWFLKKTPAELASELA